MKLKAQYILLLFLCWSINNTIAQTASTVKIGLLKYNGGGDWYANPTSLPNLIEFANKNLKTNISPEPLTVEPGNSTLFNVPLVHATGHGNILFSEYEVENLRSYLEGGGFIHFDDNYGMDEFVRREMKKVFPNQEFVELPFDHPIYHQQYDFDNGLPKIHEHDLKAAKGFGLFHEGRLVVFYTYECDLGDGWESAAVHGDPELVRLEALKMGANIISFVFNQQQFTE